MSMDIRKTHVFIFFISLFMLSSCGGNSSRKGEYSSVLYTPEYASGFTIKGAGGCESALLTTSNPWQDADSVDVELFVRRNGERIPDGFTGQVLEGDAKRIVAMSSTHIAMLDALGEADRIVGVSGIDFITNKTIRENKDEIADIGFDGNINYELLVSVNPDLVLLYGVTGASAMEGKLRQLRIPFMYVGDYMEESPLGKAEWIVALSEVIGKRAEGEKVFSGLPDRYDSLKGRVDSLNGKKPEVMINTPYSNAWFMPSDKSYMIQLIRDAGGNYVYKKNQGNSSIPVDIEEAYMLAVESDVWINTGVLNSLEELKAACPKFMDTECVRKGKVYNNNLRTTPSGGNDFYESAIVHPDLVLRDLIKIFHPDAVPEEFVYYKKLQ